MSPQRFAVLAVLCGTLVLNGWVAAGLVGLGSPRHRKRRSADRGRHTASDRNCQGQCRWCLRSRCGIIDAALPDPGQMLPPVRIASASTPDPVQKDVEASALPFEVPEMESILAALPDPQEMLPPVAIASASTPDPVQTMSRRQRCLSKSPRWRASSLLCPTLMRCCRKPRRPCGSCPCSGLPRRRRT